MQASPAVDGSSNPHATLVKFGYPRTLVHQGRHWALLVRPAQPTLGSLILCATGEQRAYGELPAEAFVEQGELVPRVERLLREISQCERINYLMLMMVDPHVHFHVIPRYCGERTFDGVAFPDAGWPAVPDLASAQPASEALISAMRDSWP
jgi:diadenosine tetraphosphate (Ap4A) HIT family hydrolase